MGFEERILIKCVKHIVPVSCCNKMAEVGRFLTLIMRKI